MSDLSNLERLDLWKTSITDAGLIHLEALPKLQMVELETTKTTQAGRMHFLQSLREKAVKK